MYLLQLSRPRRASRVPSRLGDENGPAAAAAPRLASKSSSTSLAGVGAVTTRAAAKQVSVVVAGPVKAGLSNASVNTRRPTFTDVSNATAARAVDRTSKDSLGAIKPSRSRQTSGSSIAPATNVLQPPSSTGTGIHRLKLNHPSSGAAVPVPVPTKRTASRAGAPLAVKQQPPSSSQPAAPHAEGGTWQWTEPADDVEVLRDAGPSVGLGIAGAGAAFDDVWSAGIKDEDHLDATVRDHDDPMLADDVKPHVSGSHKRSHSGTQHNIMDSDAEDQDDDEDDPHMGGGKVRVVEAQPTDDVVVDLEDWTMGADEDEEESRQLLDDIKREFDEQLDFWDTTMVAEYAGEIFEYMTELENKAMPNPRYMDHQQDIEWSMRTTLIDWLLQVHMRYHMLPETLWIAINIIDRFLSNRVVSLVKFQLVGVTAMFVAAKYEEIMAPSVEEFVYMTEGGYTREEILKGERIILQSLEFNISPYCSPYTWVRRISKADDYDIQTRTLSKFLMEVTLLDHRFLRAKPSMIAAIGMYLARRMLGGEWNDAFIYYSNYTEAQLVTPTGFLVESIAAPDFEKKFVFKKYAAKKFLKASHFARNWAKANAAALSTDDDSPIEG
ncbi:hypothetical protein RQP46_007195 [Phenoliferia psychrophenolica]